VSAASEPGPLADEAARLVAAGLEWAQRTASAIDPGGDRIATGAAECAGCPVCRAVRALRDPSPDTAERLTAVVTELATMVVAGLRTVDARRGHDPGHPTDQDRPNARRGRGPRGSGVEHIDIA